MLFPPQGLAGAVAAEVLELVYKAPEYIPELNTIRLTIPQEDMRRLAAEYDLASMNPTNHTCARKMVVLADRLTCCVSRVLRAVVCCVLRVACCAG